MALLSEKIKNKTIFNEKCKNFKCFLKTMKLRAN